MTKLASEFKYQNIAKGSCARHKVPVKSCDDCKKMAKVRRVSSPAGVRRYHAPEGTPIVAGRAVQTAGSFDRLAQMAPTPAKNGAASRIPAGPLTGRSAHGNVPSGKPKPSPLVGNEVNVIGGFKRVGQSGTFKSPSHPGTLHQTSNGWEYRENGKTIDSAFHLSDLMRRTVNGRSAHATGSRHKKGKR